MNNIKKLKRILFLILLLNIVFATQLFSQNKYKRKISISKWLAEMENCKDSVYQLTDTEIFYDKSKDSLYSHFQPRGIEPTEKDKKSVINITPTVIIADCKLPYNATSQIRNVVFHNNVTFVKCEGAAQFIFYNCTFEQGFDFHHSDLRDLEFMYCSIRQRMVINELQSSIFFFSNCSFYTDYKVVKSSHLFGFEKENHTAQLLFYFRQNEKKIGNFTLSNCKLLPTEVKPILTFYGGKYDGINFNNTNFSNSIINFNSCSVKENFTVENCKFTQPIGMSKFNFPKDNTSFLWNQIDSVGIGLYKGIQAYTHKTDTLLSDIHLFNNLNSSYRKFFSMYRTQGDMESANACYKQMKDMETGRYHYLYQQHPSVQKWFNWRFNQFLKHFSEYGTSPVQSLIVSMWTILFFAAVYFFFYSDWDGINRSFLIKNHRKLMQYFRSEQRLEDFYTENYKEDLQTFTDYKKEMEESKSKLPFFITLLGKPLYMHSIIKHKIMTFLYRRTEILQGRWVDLKPKRKVFVGLTVSLSIIVYLIYLVFIRAVNSTTLSVNAFSTLGFGAIPVKGASRYITILEGFLGWFLLSIFSVSLISQMLQN